MTVPQTFGGHVVFGVQHWPYSPQVVVPEQLLEQSNELPVHESWYIPQNPEGQVVTGVQHCCEVPQVVVPLQVPQVTVLPLQSVLVPQSLGPQGLEQLHELFVHC